MVMQSKSMSLKVAKSLNNGGRALKAIWSSQALDAEETLIMMYLGSQLNFLGDFTESVPRFVSTISKSTKLAERTVQRRMKSLNDRGYIEIVSSKSEKGGNTANRYSLTDLIFEEYASYLTDKEQEEERGGVTARHQGGDSQTPGGVTARHQGGDCQTPISVLSSSPCNSKSLSIGWVEGEQPANSAVDVIDIVKRVEPLFANPKTGFVPFSELNAVFVEIKAKQGKAAAICFTDYLKQIWEASSQGPWLGTGSEKPQDFRLSVLSLPKYLRWWGETFQESLDWARMPH